VLLVSLFRFDANTLAQDNSPTENSLSDSIWYDSDEQTTVPIVVRDETEDSVNRDSRWLPKAARLRDTAGPAAGSATGSTGLFGTEITMGYLLGWVFLLVVIAAVISIFAYAVFHTSFELSGTGNGRKRVTGEGGVDEQTLQRVKHLPAELRRTDVNMRDEAERLMNAGRFDQAIILLFGHQLLLLDRAGILRLNRSKTNGKYVREARAAHRAVAHSLQQTVDCFERSYFGKHSITGDEFGRLWALNERLEAEIATAEGVAV
jgi:hypothetical protein